MDLIFLHLSLMDRSARHRTGFFHGKKMYSLPTPSILLDIEPLSLPDSTLYEYTYILVTAEKKISQLESMCFLSLFADAGTARGMDGFQSCRQAVHSVYSDQSFLLTPRTRKTYLVNLYQD